MGEQAVHEVAPQTTTEDLLALTASCTRAVLQTAFVTVKHLTWLELPFEQNLQGLDQLKCRWTRQTAFH